MITSCPPAGEGPETTEAQPAIVYTVIQNWDDPSFLPDQKGSYFSCMAQGNCGDPTTPGPRTPYPVAVIEGDPLFDFQRSIWLAYNNKARFVLYYKLTKKLATCWEPGALYSEGGNGDGTALYVDRRTGEVIPSLRLVHWHIAQQAVEKEILLSAPPRS